MYKKQIAEIDHVMEIIKEVNMNSSIKEERPLKRKT